MAERYKIYEKLGAGGVGAVFRAYDSELKRWVAIKRLLNASDASKDDDTTAELRREADALASLRNPNIVTIFDVSTDAEGLFMVMELLEGEDLADVVTRGPLNYDDFKELASQTLEALLAAHQRHILHRDIKPENIKVERLPGGRLQSKIIDFGLARSGLRARKQTEDNEGTVMGSIYYMAPEQLTREPVDERTDLYALGCVFYETLSGRKAFDGESMGAVIDKHVNHDIIPLDVVAPHVPPWLGAWVLRLMAQKPTDRPNNAQQGIEEFRAWEKMAAAPTMMPWMPYGQQPPVAGSYTQQISGAETVPLQGFFQPRAEESVYYAEPVVEAAKPVVEMGAYTTQLSRPKTATPHPAVTGKHTVRHIGRHTAGGRISQHIPHEEEERPSKKTKPLLLVGGAILFLALLAWIVFGRSASKPASETSSAASTVAEAAPDPNPPPAVSYKLPQGRPSPPASEDIVVHLVPDTGLISHRSINGKPLRATPDEPVIEWHDLAKLGGDNMMVAYQDSADYAPKNISWPLSKGTPVGIKPDRNTLDFHPHAGSPTGLSLADPSGQKDKFPFGKTSATGERGLTLAIVFQADGSKLPTRILTLTNDSEAAVTLRVDQNRSLIAEYRNGAAFGSIASRDINSTFPCVAIVTWQASTGKFELRVIDAPGKGFRGSGPAVATPDAAMYHLQLGLPKDAAQPASGSGDQYMGFLGDVILYASMLKNDQLQVLSTSSLRDFYLQGPPPKPPASPKLPPQPKPPGTK